MLESVFRGEPVQDYAGFVPPLAKVEDIIVNNFQECLVRTIV